MKTDETHLTRSNDSSRADPGETRLTDIAAHQLTQPENALKPGESVVGSYIVNAALGAPGNQANIYLAKKAGRSYVIKLYHEGWRPSDKLREFLMRADHPNLAHILECDQFDNRYYEIYEYYSECTLDQQTKYPPLFIQKTVVPSINEGLKALHTNGFVHCDIKPSNLFLCNDASSVVIGDYGVSGYTNAGDKYIDSFRGTPEYAPPVMSHFGNVFYSPPYDYCSFGLVLYRLLMGHSLFGGMSTEEIASAWQIGLPLHNPGESRLWELIHGLLSTDENMRWGYRQVKGWCGGEYIGTVDKGIQNLRRKATEQPKRPLIFGRFDNQTVIVTTLHQLAEAVRSHWDHTAKLLKRRELLDFLRQFDPDHTAVAKELALLRDTDAAIFRFLYSLEFDSKIFYCGRDYGSEQQFLESLSSAKDDTAIRFVTSGLFTYYLRLQGRDAGKVDEVEKHIAKSKNDGIFSVQKLCHIMRSVKSLTIRGQTVESVETFIDAIAMMSTKEISDLLEDSNVMGWLYGFKFSHYIDKLSSLREGIS